MIEVEGLTKRFGRTTAVDDVTFRVPPGRVTAFLGPNGAGKSTTMRVVLGLDRPTTGGARVLGKPYREHREPLRVVGAHLDGRGAHPGRPARAHLRALARSNGIGGRRVEEVLEMVGIGEVAGRRAGTYSLGMAQRLGIAAALLGDPSVLVLDEPVNGMDADGVRWVRGLLQRLAEQGRTVLVSSHLLAEVAQTAAHVLVLARGRLVADCPLEALLAGTDRHVELATPDHHLVSHLLAALPGAGLAHGAAQGCVLLRGVTAAQVGNACAALGLRVHHLAAAHQTLESAYERLVGSVVQFSAGSASGEQAA